MAAGVAMTRVAARQSVLISLLLLAGIVLVMSGSVTALDGDETTTETVPEASPLETKYEGDTANRTHESDPVAATTDDGLQISPGDIDLAPGGTYSVAVTVPDAGSVDDAQLELTVDGADAEIERVTTLVSEGGFDEGDRVDDSENKQRVEYATDTLVVDETVLLTLVVPAAEAPEEAVSLSATYQAEGGSIEAEAESTYELIEESTTFDALAARADARAALAEEYAETYAWLEDGGEGTFDTVFRRSMVDATTTIGIELAKDFAVGPFHRVEAALDTKEAYDTAIKGDGTTNEILESLDPIISSFGEFDEVRESNVFDEDDTGTSLEQLAKHQRAEADAWRDRDRDAALEAIAEQERAICVSDTFNKEQDVEDRETFPCVFWAAHDQSSAADTWDVPELNPYFDAVVEYAVEEQAYVDEQLLPLATTPEPVLGAEPDHDAFESELEELTEGEQTTLEITVSNTAEKALAEAGYLTISHSQSLDIVAVEQTAGNTDEPFERTDIDVGETIVTREGEQEAEYPLTDIVESYAAGESNTYAVTFERVTDDAIWLTYRTAHLPAVAEQQQAAFERAPTTGETDQQGWEAYRLEGNDSDDPDDDPEEAFFDVTIDDLTDPVTEGEDIVVELTVENTGEEFGSQTVSVGAPNLGTESISVGLSGGTTTSETIRLGTAVGDADDYTLTANTDDTSDSAAVTVVSDDTDLDFDVSIVGTNEPVLAGETLTLEATITNEADRSGTQTVTAEIPEIGTDSKAISLDSGGGTFEEFDIETAAGDEGERTLTLSSASDSESVSVGIRDAAGSEGETVYAGSFDGWLYALDTDTGTVEWNYEAGSFLSSSPTVVDGTVYVGAIDGASNDHGVHALDAPTGAVEWTTDAGGEVSSSPTVVDGTVYIGSDDKKVYALDADDGAVEWQYETDGEVDAAPAVVDGTVYVGSDDNHLYALDANDGSLEWRTETHSVVASPTVVEDTVYVVSGGSNGKLYALSALDGSIEWEREVSVGSAAAPTIVDETVYLGAAAFDVTDGSTRWDAEMSVSGSATVVDDTVYVAVDGDSDVTGSNTVAAFDAADGTELWSYDTGDRIRSTPTVADGTVYVGSYDEHLYALDASDGTVEWEYQTDHWITTSSPTVVDETSSGESIDSRVSLGTLGHHHAWAETAGSDLVPFDIAIESVNAPVAGDELTVDLAVTNQGEEEQTQAVEIGVPELGTDATQVELAGGDSTVVTLALATTTDDAGEYTLTAETETDSASTAVEVEETGGLSLSVLDTDSPIEAGETLTATVSLDNSGTDDEELTVTATVPTVGTESTTLELPAGESATESLRIPTEPGDAGSYSLTVEAGEQQANADVTIEEAPTTEPGAVKRQLDLPADRVDTSPTVVDGTIYVAGWNGVLYAVSEATGEIQWEAEIGDDIQPVTVAGETVLVNNGGLTTGNLTALDAETGEIEWKRTGVGTAMDTPTVSNGTVYLATGDLLAFDLETGDKEWKKPLDGARYSTVVGEFAYVATSEGTAAVDTVTGQVVWERGGGTMHEPTVADGKVFSVDTSGRYDSINAYDAVTGEVLWRTSKPSPRDVAPTVANGFVYVATEEDARVRALDPETGEIQWESEYSSSGIRGAPTVADETVYVSQSVSGGIHAFDAMTGEERWETTNLSESFTSPLVADGTVYIGDHDGTFWELDAGVSGSSDGSRVQQGIDGHHERLATDIDPSREPVVIDAPRDPDVGEQLTFETDTDADSYEWDLQDGTVETGQTITHTYTDPGTYIVELRVESGEMTRHQHRVLRVTEPGNAEWITDQPGDGRITTSPTVVDGTAYLGMARPTTEQTGLYAIGTERGAVKWRHLTDDAVETAPTVVDGTAYVGTENNTLYALDAETGETQWEHANLPRPIQDSPSVVGETVYVSAGELYALNGSTGAIEWQTALEPAARESTVVNGTAYVATSDGVYAFDTATGEQLWNAGTGSYRPITVVDGLVYTVSYYRTNTNLEALDAETGEQQWQYLDVQDHTPTVRNGTVYVSTSNDNGVHAVDAETGERLWASDMLSSSGTSPTVAGDTVFVSVGPGIGTEAFYAFDAGTGEPLWNVSTLEPMRYSSPTVVDSTAYVGSEGGTLWAIDAGVTGHSDGSRVLQAVHGHHHEIIGEITTPDTVFELPSVVAPNSTESEEVDIEATVQNTGDRDGTQEITLSVEGEPVETVEDVEIPADESKTLVFENITLGTEPGTYNLTVETDDDSKTVQTAVVGDGAVEGELFFTDALLAEPVTNPVTIEIAAVGEGTEQSTTVTIDATTDTVPVPYQLEGLPAGEYELAATVVAIDGDPSRSDELAIEAVDTPHGSVTVEPGETVSDIDYTLVEALPIVTGDSPPQDLNDDGLYRDIRGDGELTIFDVQALFDNLDNEELQEHAELFDFAGNDPETVSIFDVQALFDDLQAGVV